MTKGGHHRFLIEVWFKVVKCAAMRNLVCWLFAMAFLLCRTSPVLAVVWHPDGEPNLATWTGKPDSNVVGRWSSNASFVVIAPNWIATTRHQGRSPSTVTISGVPYVCYYKPEWTGGPLGNADIRLIRLTTADGKNPELAHYANPYMGTDEEGLQVVLGGYGDGRGGLLQTAGTTYGYEWDDTANTTRRFGTNIIEGVQDDSVLGSHTSDIIIADFDGLEEGQSTPYESTLASHDSGGGWFIYDGDEWKVAGLSRGVGIHYEPGHYGDPDYILCQAWFRNRENPLTLQPDYLDAVRISSYAEWIIETISVPGDLTGDDWVDSADFAILASYWTSVNCSEQNNWCEGADFEPTYGRVDHNDLAFLVDRWLTGWQY